MVFQFDDNGYANCMIFGRFHNNIINLKMLHVCRIQRKSLYDYRSNRKNGIKSKVALQNYKNSLICRVQ